MRAVLLLACAGLLTSLAGVAASQPADATNGAFDGIYAGGLTQTSKNCLSGTAAADPWHVRLAVRAGAFSWTINKVRTMIPIGKDGEIATKTPYIELRGRAVGRVLEWDSVNNNCFNKWHFDKQ